MLSLDNLKSIYKMGLILFLIFIFKVFIFKKSKAAQLTKNDIIFYENINFTNDFILNQFS